MASVIGKIDTNILLIRTGVSDAFYCPDKRGGRPLQGTPNARYAHPCFVVQLVYAIERPNMQVFSIKKNQILN